MSGSVRYFATPEEFHDRLIELAEQKPVKALIGTYSIYAGIQTSGKDATEWGEDYRSPVHDIFERLKDAGCDTKILVGVPNSRSCFVDCQNCKYRKFKMLKRFLATSKRWPEFEWKFHDSSHLKMVALTFEDGSEVVVTGGRNLSGSSWEDFSIELPGVPEQILKVFSSAWASGYEPELLKGKLDTN